jgi:hypothetical protein
MLFASLIIATAVVLAGLGLITLGRRLFKSTDSSSILTDTALGIGGLSLVVLAFGALQLYSGVGKYILLGLCGVLTLFGSLRVISELRNKLKARSSSKQKLTLNNVLPILLLIAIACAVLLAGSAPPAMDDWDTLAYHLTVPRLYIDHGGLYYIDFSSHSNFPMLLEMLYIPGLMLGNPVAAKLVHFIIGILFVLAVIRLTEKHIQTGAGYLAGIATAGIPIVMWEGTTGYIDLATALYTILAVEALLNMQDENKPKLALIAGLFAGFTASTKLLGTATILLIGAWLIIQHITLRRKSLGPVLIWFCLGALICLPWYLRTFINTGSPVFPFFYSIFGGRDWNTDLAQTYTASQAHFGMGHGLLDLIKLPYNITVFSERFYDTPGLYVGPILLVGLPMLLVLIKYRTSKTLGLAGFVIAQVLLWFALTQQSRYLFPVYGLLGALSAGLAYKMESIKILKTGLWVIFTVTALCGLYTIIPLAIDRSAVAFGSESSSDYLSRSVDVYRADNYINENLPKDAKVALFGDTRGLYLNRDFAWADWGHNTRFSREYTNSTDLMLYLRSQGFTHTLVNLRFLPKDHHGPLVVDAITQGLLVQEYPSYGSGAKVGVYSIPK